MATEPTFANELLQKFGPEPAKTVDYHDLYLLYVDKIPVAPKEKVEKLTGFLLKVITKFVPTFKAENLTLALADDGSTKGYMFLDMENKENQKVALEKLNGFKFDKKHTFEVMTIEDFEGYENTKDTFEPPVIKEYKAQPDTTGWMSTPQFVRGDDMVMIKVDTRISLSWGSRKFKKFEEIANIEDDGVQPPIFSPKGSYLAVFTFDGVELYSGNEFNTPFKVIKHPYAEYAEFSPCERFIITYKNKDIFLWDIATEKPLFRIPSIDPEAKAPFMQWDAKGAFCARLEKDANSEDQHLTLYMTEKGTKVRLPYQHPIVSFALSPRDQYLAVFSKETTNQPATVSLLDMSDFESSNKFTIIRTHSLYSVTNCGLRWSADGMFLCGKVDMEAKKKDGKRHTVSNLLIFRARAKGCPTEVISIKEKIISSEFEPHHITQQDKTVTRLAVIHLPDPESKFATVSFFKITPKTITLEHTIKEKKVSRLWWSPAGRMLVLGDIESGTFDFFDTEEYNPRDTFEFLHASSVAWSPSGNYASIFAIDSGKHYETGYNILSCTGELLDRVPAQGFGLFCWRPRPALSLPQKQQREIFLDLKEYSKRYNTEEKNEEKKARQAIEEERRKHKAQIDSIAREGLLRYLALIKRHVPDTEMVHEYELLEHTVTKPK